MEAQRPEAAEQAGAEQRAQQTCPEQPAKNPPPKRLRAGWAAWVDGAAGRG